MKPKEQRFVKLDVPFINEISSLTMIKLLDLKTGCANKIKMKFVKNTAFLDVTTNSSKPLIFSEDEALGIVDLRCIGYYKVNQSIIQLNLNYYEF